MQEETECIMGNLLISSFGSGCDFWSPQATCQKIRAASFTRFLILASINRSEECPAMLSEQPLLQHAAQTYFWAAKCLLTTGSQRKDTSQKLSTIKS
eukprot:6195307-Pleurochrysis_carterae.AAC.2